MSCALKQRVRNRQPLGGFIGLGTSPVRMIRSRSRSIFGLAAGAADNSACVYGWAGRSYTSSRVPFSTILPRYITATRSEMCRTTDRSCAMKM